MPSNWEGALGSPGGCEMQGFCQGSSSCEMGTWGWRKGAFKGTKRWKNPNLCSGSFTLTQMDEATSQGLAVSSLISELQGHGDTCGAPQLPPGCFLLHSGQSCAVQPLESSGAGWGLLHPILVPSPVPQAV